MGFVSCIAIVSAFIAGAVLYRCRGGFIGTGSTTLARLMWWCIPSALLFMAAYHAKTGELSLLLGLAVMLALWGGLLIPHGWTQNNRLKDYLGMGAVGLCRGAALSLALLPWVNGVAFAVAYGIGSGVGYALGWSYLDGKELIKWRPKNPKADDGSGFDRFAISGGEWGEVLTGGLIWGLWSAIIMFGMV